MRCVHAIVWECVFVLAWVIESIGKLIFRNCTSDRVIWPNIENLLDLLCVKLHSDAYHTGTQNGACPMMRAHVG